LGFPRRRLHGKRVQPTRAGSHAAQLGSFEVARKYWTAAEKSFESMGSEGEPFVSAVRHRLSLLPPVSNDPRPVAEPAQDVGTLEQEAGIVGSLMMYFRNLNLADQAHEPSQQSGRQAITQIITMCAPNSLVSR
jgi:hypothetical protein